MTQSSQAFPITREMVGARARTRACLNGRAGLVRLLRKALSEIHERE